MAEGRSHPRGEQFSALNSQLSQAVGNFTQLLSSATAFGQAINQFRTLETQLALTNAAAGGTISTFKQMEEAARSFALSTTATAQETASAMFYLAQAGYTVQQSMNALSGVMVLAQATMQDVAFTSDLIASTLKTYNLTSQDSVRIANLFAAAQTNSLASLDKLAFSLRQVGPVAASMGQDIETTTAFLNELYNIGLRGEQAGTALRNVMVRLAKPVGAASDVLTKYGIATTTATGQTRDLKDILLDIQKAGFSMSEAVDVAGVEALSGFLALVDSVGTGSFDAQRDAITDTTAAFDMAIQQIDTLDGSLKRAKNAMNDLFITMGEELAPIIRAVADGVRDLVLWFNSLSESNRSMLVTVGLTIASLVALSAAWRSIGLAFGPLSTSMTKLLVGTGKGVDGATKKVGLLGMAFSALRTAITFVFSGAMISSIMGIGTAITGVTAQATNLRQVFTTMNGVKFLPLLAGLGAVGLAIAGTGGLIYAIYKVTAAWNEANRASAEAIALQRERLIEAAGLTGTDLPNIQNRQRQNELAFAQAGDQGPAEAVAYLQNIIRRNENDQKKLEEAKASFDATSGGWVALGDAIAASSKVREQITGYSEQARNLNPLEAIAAGLSGGRTLEVKGGFKDPFAGDGQVGLDLLREEVSRSASFAEEITALVQQQYTPENISAIQAAMESAAGRRAQYDAQIASFVAGGIDQNSEEFKKLVGLQQEAKAAESEAAATLEKLRAGIEDNEVLKALPELSAATAALNAAVASAADSGGDGGASVTKDESAILLAAQQRFREALGVVSSFVQAEITAATGLQGELDSLARAGKAQIERSRAGLIATANNFLDEVIGGEFSVDEFFGDNSQRVVAFFKQNADKALPILEQQLREGGVINRQLLVDTITKLQESGVTVPQELVDYLKATSPAGIVATAFKAARAELTLGAAEAVNEMKLAQAEATNNLAGGISAEQTKIALEAVKDFAKLNDDVKKQFTDAFGDINYKGVAIGIDKAKAEQLGIADALAAYADESGEAYTGTIGQLLDFEKVMEPVYEAMKSGDATQIARAAEAAAAQWDAQVKAAIAILSEQLNISGTEASGLQALKDFIGAKLGSIMGPLSAQIADIPNQNRIKSKYSPDKASKGKSPQETAIKLRKDFEKELLATQRELLGIERDVLTFDNTIDFTARFTAMVDMDRKEIAQKYDQRIQEVQTDIMAANEKFKAQPAYLGQLVTGYNELISQLERAKQAELEYTNTFTYQSEVRNAAIDRQVDSIRNMSKEGQEAGKAIIDGIRAGFLLYQKDLRTTVDNVASATMGVLDGMAEAVGAFVTGSGDAIDILRNAILSSLNDLIVDATKRMLQTALEGLTGGALTGGFSGERENAVKPVDPLVTTLNTAAQQTQMVYSSHLTQMQEILTSFATGFGAALDGVVSTVSGAASGSAGSGGGVMSTLSKGFSSAASIGKSMLGMGMEIGKTAISNIRDGIIATAKELQINPLDLAKAISFETGGTFDPMKRGPTTKWGQHRGLIQFGEPQAAQYGADFSSPMAALQSQLGPNGAIVKFLRASGFKNGMSGLDLYSTINAGAPGKYGASDTAAGGTWGTVADKWNSQMAGHLQNAERLLGDFSGSLGGIAEKTADVATDFGSGMENMGQSPISPELSGQFLQQLQAILSQFLQQFASIAQQMNPNGGAAPGQVGFGGSVGVDAPADPSQQAQGQMDGFMGGIMSIFQSLFGGLGSMLQGLLQNIFGLLGGGGGFLGLFDNGGNIPRGKWGIAGEFGPEVIKGPASVTSRKDTMNMFRNAAESGQRQAPAAPPVVNNYILQDPRVVGQYLSTSEGRKQVANIVNSTRG